MKKNDSSVVFGIVGILILAYLVYLFEEKKHIV